MRSFAGTRSQRTMMSARTVPALVFESPKVPSVPLSSPLGAVLGVTGAVLVVDALLSIFGSPEQTTLATIFRLFRLTAGGGLLVWVAASSAK
jgi:hypothetical protein